MTFNRDGIDATIADLLAQDHQILFFAVKAEFDSGDVRVWSGDGDLSVGGENYLGVGTLLQISGAEDNLELTSTGVSVSLAGMDTTVLNLALTENYQNRFLTIFLGFLSGSTDVSVGTMTIFKGRMQSMSINDDPNGSTINIDAENRLIDLNRPSNLRYTKESQKYIDSSDSCFNRVQALADKEVIWGKSSTNTGRGSGGRGGGVGPDSAGGRNDKILSEFK
tara:strand:+ start:7052 stop:7717 length:666 start_codon:yes stop_codon:yes gene_type:complete